MHLNGTSLHKLLLERPDRFIWHDRTAGHYTVKESDGDDVTVHENGEDYPIRPPEFLVDQLLDNGHLSREGAKYLPK